jgi:hypothetical protein
MAFAALGSAVASGYRGDWAWAALMGVLAVLPAVLWARGSMADTREMMAMLGRPERQQ